MRRYPVVILTPREHAEAFEHADVMTERAKRNGYSEARTVSDLPDKFVRRHATAAELAAAIYLGDRRRWNKNIDAFHGEPDAWPDIEVRNITQSHHRLAVYDHDVDGRKAVLAYGYAPRFEIRGWEWTHIAKQIGSFEDAHDKGVGAYYVRKLRDMEELFELERLAGVGARNGWALPTGWVRAYL